MERFLTSQIIEINDYIKAKKFRINDYNDSLKAINSIVDFSNKKGFKLDEEFIIKLLGDNYRFYHMVSKVVGHVNMQSDEETKDLNEALILIISSFYIYNEQLSNNNEDIDYDKEFE